MIRNNNIIMGIRKAIFGVGTQRGRSRISIDLLSKLIIIRGRNISEDLGPNRATIYGGDIPDVRGGAASISVSYL